MNPTALWLTPIIALPGIALLIISTSARYTRVHEELHHLEAHRTGPHLRRLARTLLGRAVLFRNALVGLYLCVTLFALAGVVGGVVSIWMGPAVWVVHGLTFTGTLVLLYSAAQLIRESLISLEVIREHFESLEL